MASIILELTADATMDSLSGPFCCPKRIPIGLYVQEGERRMTYPAVYPSSCTALVSLPQKEYPAGLL
jgi:hypothetical protein